MFGAPRTQLNVDTRPAGEHTERHTERHAERHAERHTDGLDGDASSSGPSARDGPMLSA